MEPILKQAIQVIAGCVVLLTIGYIEGHYYGYRSGAFEAANIGYKKGYSAGLSSIQLECPPCLCQKQTCLPEKTCQTCLPCPVCEHCLICQKPVCEGIHIPANIEKISLNLGRTQMANKAPAVQHGYYLCLQDIWELFNVTGRPKFYPGPSTDIKKDFYSNTLIGINITDDKICFKKQYGSEYGMHGRYNEKGFFLNSSLWNWTNTNNTWMVWNITENNTNAWLEYNISDNLWVQQQ